MAGGSSSNDLSYNIDPKSALAAIRQIQDAHKAMAKSGVAAGEELDASLVATENLYKNLITITDRQLQAQNRLAKSYALQADQAGKSAEDRIIARRDAVIRQLGQNQKAIDLVTASTKKLIEAERAATARLWSWWIWHHPFRHLRG
jgi:hypothetical protein